MKHERLEQPNLSRSPSVGFCQVLNELELAGQAMLVKVGKKEQPALEAFLSPKDEEAGKRFETLVDNVKKKVGVEDERCGG